MIGHLLYTILGFVYAAVFTSCGQHILMYFDKGQPFDKGYWMVWGLWIVIPALACGVLEKLTTLATMREHESLFDTDPLTTVLETAAQGIPAFFRGVLYGIGVLIANVIIDAVLLMNLVREVLNALGLPYPPGAA